MDSAALLKFLDGDAAHILAQKPAAKSIPMFPGQQPVHWELGGVSQGDFPHQPLQRTGGTEIAAAAGGGEPRHLAARPATAKFLQARHLTTGFAPGLALCPAPGFARTFAFHLTLALALSLEFGLALRLALRFAALAIGGYGHGLATDSHAIRTDGHGRHHPNEGPCSRYRRRHFRRVCCPRCSRYAINVKYVAAV